MRDQSTIYRATFAALTVVLILVFEWTHYARTQTAEGNSSGQTALAEEMQSPNFVWSDSSPFEDSKDGKDVQIAVGNTTSTLPTSTIVLSSKEAAALPPKVLEILSQTTGQKNFVSPEKQDQSAQNNPPEIATEVGYASDLTTGRELYSLRSERRWPIASITKLMTAYIAYKNYPMSKIVKVNYDENTLAGAGNPGTVMVGESFTVQDLLGVMLVSSSNEAAEALAGADSREDFLKQMNNQAKEWGMADTNYEDPTGLSVSNQSNVKDLARLAAKIYTEHPEIFNITRKKTWTALELNTHRKRTVQTTNEFAGQPDFLGGKTGYTTEAGNNLLSVFSLNKMPVVIVVLGADDRFQATRDIYGYLKSISQVGG